MKSFLYFSTLVLWFGGVNRGKAQAPSSFPEEPVGKEVATPKEPRNNGPFRLVSASWLEWEGGNEIVGVTMDKKVLLGGNGRKWPQGGVIARPGFRAVAIQATPAIRPV